MTLAHVLTPGSVWRAWTLEPFELIPLAAVAVLYARGARGLHEPVLRRRQVFAFGTGIGVLTLALASPLAALADTLFSGHMVQHLLLWLVAAPLIVYGRPLLAIGLGLPVGVRRALRPSRILRALAHPLVVWGLYAAALWGWHLPGPYQAAVHSPAIHALEHLSFLGTALLFWGVVVGVPRRRLSYGATLAFVFTTMLHSVWLAMVLSFVPTPIYPVYEPGTALWAWASLADQQVAGVVMWVPSAIVLFVTLAVLFLRWFRELDARMAPEVTA